LAAQQWESLLQEGTGADLATADLTAQVLDSPSTLAFGGDAFVISREGVHVPLDGGLTGALRDLVTRLKRQSGPSVDISISEVSRLGLSAAVSDHLYRIAQEAIANALKHANASSIKVTLDVALEHVRLEICDDGGGVKEVGQNARGLGLRTMQYRASMIGARFEIAPFRPKGTRVICDCPQVG
jgi:two-component system, LuxR family, sensor kinase FixL